MKCVICGEEIEGEYGNNPDPVRSEGRCCDVCNMKYVVPFRIIIAGIEDNNTRKDFTAMINGFDQKGLDSCLEFITSDNKKEG